MTLVDIWRNGQRVHLCRAEDDSATVAAALRADGATVSVEPDDALGVGSILVLGYHKRRHRDRA